MACSSTGRRRSVVTPGPGWARLATGGPSSHREDLAMAGGVRDPTPGPARRSPAAARAARYRDLARLARRQFGVVTVAQAEALGLHRTDLHRLMRAGHLVPRFRGVYAMSGAPDSREARWFAAQAALGPRAVLSHRTAASVHGLAHGLPA